jgi:hypothetical protein
MRLVTAFNKVGADQGNYKISTIVESEFQPVPHNSMLHIAIIAVIKVQCLQKYHQPLLSTEGSSAIVERFSDTLVREILKESYSSMNAIRLWRSATC